MTMGQNGERPTLVPVTPAYLLLVLESFEYESVGFYHYARFADA